MKMANNIDYEKHKKTPHEALFLSITYFPLFELLSISETCTSMRDAVINDTLPYIHITIDRCLSYRLSDQILMKYALKANGRLKSLVMVKCVKITDNGLLQVIQQNPFITKLHVQGCTGLTPDGIISVVKALSKHGPNLISLKVNGIYDITKQHLLTLKSLLMENIINNHSVPSKEKENDSPIDLDICPRCDQVRVVFACSKENCTRRKNLGVSECKSCSYCIKRCVDCSKCIDEREEVVEVACEDALCIECWIKFPKCIFCNQPYCKNHAKSRDIHEESDGFVCHNCAAKSSWSKSYD